MKLAEKHQFFRNAITVVLNEGIARGYFGAEQGQNYKIPNRNDEVEYDVVVHHVPCHVCAVRTGFEGQELHIYVDVLPQLPGPKGFDRQHPRAACLFEFWIWCESGKFQVDPAFSWNFRVDRKLFATVKDALCADCGIVPIGYSPTWLMKN